MLKARGTITFIRWKTNTSSKNMSIKKSICKVKQNIKQQTLPHDFHSLKANENHLTIIFFFILFSFLFNYFSITMGSSHRNI